MEEMGLAPQGPKGGRQVNGDSGHQILHRNQLSSDI